MQLRVRHFRQPNKDACVAGGVEILLNDKKKRISFKKIVPGVNTTKDGTDLIHAAIFCAKKGTTPTLYWSNFDRIPESYGKLTPEEAARVVKRRKEKGWPWSKLAEFIEAGGKWYPRRRTARLIRSVLKRGIPMMLDVNDNRWPFGSKNSDKDAPHVIVAIGFTDTHLLYLDPGGSPTVKRVLWKTFYRLSRRFDGDTLFLT